MNAQFLIVLLAMFLLSNGIHSAPAKNRENEKFPYLIAIGKTANNDSEFFHHCGGSLIYEDVVLTSASCLMEKDSKITDKSMLRVYAGEEVFNISNSLDYKDVLWTKTHPKFKLSSTKHNIGIVKCIEKFTLGPTISTIPMWKRGQLKNKKCTVIGFGKGDKRFLDDLVPFFLEFIWETVTNSGYCILNEFVKLVYNKMDKYNLRPSKRAGKIKDEKCTDEPGNPLVCNKILFAVMTRGQCKKKSEGIFTKVQPYISWIEKSRN